MIKIKSKDFDLNTLFQFDLLREVLLNIAEFQNDIQSEIMALKKNDKIQDMRLSRLEQRHDIKFDPSEFNINIINLDKSPEFVTSTENNKNTEKDLEEKGKKEENDIFESNEKDDDEEEKKEKKMKNKYDKLLNDKANNMVSNNNSNMQNQASSSSVNQDIIRSMMKNIRENSEKISTLESKLNKDFERQIKKSKEDLKRDFVGQLSEFKGKNKILDKRINDLEQKNSEQDKLIEDLTVKCSNIDVFNMFRDSGDGTVDMAKVLVKSLEEKVFKKFELVDLRYKQEMNEVIKLKKTMENMQPVIEKYDREINYSKEEIQKIKDDINSLRELINEKKNGEEGNINEDGINQRIEDLKKELENMIKNSQNDLDNKILESVKNIQNVGEGANQTTSNNLYNDETINALEKKINDLRKKTNDLDNSFKLYMKNSEIDEIKKNIKDLRFDVDQKITKDSLKELYNLHLSDVDEINDLREHISTIFDDLRKNIRATSTLTNKVESIVGNMVSSKETKASVQKQIIDFTKYVENSKLSEVVKNFNMKIEDIYGEIESLRRDLTDLQIDCKDYEKKERVNRLEEDIYKNINDSKSTLQKNKNEIYKSIKGLEAQMKSLDDEIKLKQDADSWILAKKPLKCFNCASCEAHIKNVKNENPSDEYISWNKYPQQNEKSGNRFGRGFSHMLQMMTYDLINNLDNNTNSSNNNNNSNKEQYIPISEDFNPSTNKTNNISNDQSNKMNNSQVIDYNNKYGAIAKIAQIERSTSNIMNRLNKRETGKSSVPKNNGKLKLPKMENKKIRNDESLPYLDEEKNNINSNDSFNYNEKALSNNAESPRIVKITKKKGNQVLLNSYGSSPNIIMQNLKSPPNSNQNSRQRKMENQMGDNNLIQTYPVP